ncbi:MAG: hypothetical protein EAZ99_06210 [Alphaproteobacteria bacterium]|nr:MAG: hypothetical protein EAZ99_06210 [Alphaproteobacteria bacterium]
MSNEDAPGQANSGANRRTSDAAAKPRPAQPTKSSPSGRVPRITLDELMRRLADPEVDFNSLEPYLVAERNPRLGLAPILRENRNTVISEGDISGALGEARARGDIGMGFLNDIARGRRRVQFERAQRFGKKRPVLLAEGDSWFQYPMRLKDVVDHLSDDFSIFCISAAGAELKTMVDTHEYRDYLIRLAKDTAVTAMIFSGGGNDVAGEELKELLIDYNPRLKPHEHIKTEVWQRKRDDIRHAYRRIFTTVHEVIPKLPILVHGYDYGNPLPDQVSVWPVDGWLGEPMRARGIPDGDVQRQIVAALIDDFNELLAGLAGGNRRGGLSPHVFYVDNRGVVKDRWFDELHPDDDGYGAVAHQFRTVLKTL